MFNFGFSVDIDFSYAWEIDWQVSEGQSRAFSLNAWRARCWRQNV